MANKKTKNVHNSTNRANDVKESHKLSDWCARNSRQDLLDEWDNDKNGFGPDSITYGSVKKVWWKCKNDHSWDATPNERTNQKSGCPICSGRRVLEGVNDLATKNPRIAAEWNYERNGDLKPTQVTLCSNKRVWWKCTAGHEFIAPIAARARYHTGCPICLHDRKTSFAEKAVFHYVLQNYPDALENYKQDWLGKRELDIYVPSLNVGIEYDGSHWHSKKTIDAEKDELCKENGIQIIRIREDNCPFFDSSSFKITYGPTSAIETLDGAIKFLLEILSDGKSMEDFDVDIERDYSTILERCTTSKTKNNLRDARPDLAAEWNYEMNGSIKPEFVSLHSNKSVWWKCPKGHNYLMAINGRTGDKHSGCPICANKLIVKGINDFGSLRPDLLLEWDFEKNSISPYEIPCGSKKVVWWICQHDHSHSWSTPLYVRTGQKCGCPFCAHIKADKSNSFAALYPELLEEWDYENNQENPYELLPRSNKKFFWICKKCGYKFSQVLNKRTTRHSGCPLCAHQVLVTGINDLVTQFPDTAEEWNYEKNSKKPTEISGGTNKKYWWKCKKCGYEWEASVASRTKRHFGCPACRKRKK